jgi:hypothetical protein
MLDQIGGNRTLIQLAGTLKKISYSPKSDRSGNNISCMQVREIILELLDEQSQHLALEDQRHLKAIGNHFLFVSKMTVIAEAREEFRILKRLAVAALNTQSGT